MSLYNDDELTAPSWIDREYFEQVLKCYEKNENIKLNKLVISPACIKGDHYASIMFRCQVNYNINNSLKSKRKSFILKTLPDEGIKAETMQQTKVFETEISMYTKTLPKIERILANCGEPTKLAAEIIYHSLQPRKVLIFEDLCVSGYDIMRTRSLTEDELLLFYRKLAKLHAVTFMLAHTEDVEYITKYDEGLFSNSAVTSMVLMTVGIHKFIELLSKHEEFKIYLERVKAMQPEMFEMCKNLFKAHKLNANQNEIFVLNHGDLHMKNLMFKFNSQNQVEDFVFVDYQICCYGPMTIDFIFSQYMMMRPEFRLKRKEFMQYHFSEFIRILKKIKYEGELPKCSDFQAANLQYKHFSLFMLSTFLPLSHVLDSATEEELKEMNVSEFFENSDAVTTLYTHSGYLEELRQLLPSLLIDSYFD